MTRLKKLFGIQSGPMEWVVFGAWFALGYLGGAAMMTATGMIDPVLLPW